MKEKQHLCKLIRFGTITLTYCIQQLACVLTPQERLTVHPKMKFCPHDPCSNVPNQNIFEVTEILYVGMSISAKCYGLFAPTVFCKWLICRTQRCFLSCCINVINCAGACVGVYNSCICQTSDVYSQSDNITIIFHQQNNQDSDNLHYAALKEFRPNWSPRQTDDTQSECVYSGVRQQELEILHLDLFRRKCVY